MIFGIGTDIVRIERIEHSLGRYGDAFARRILADTELEEFEQSLRQASFLAKRFAAKEAMSKALGTGFRDGLSLRHIVVTHDALGRPCLLCNGKADELLQELGISACHLSLADEREYAIAFVTLEKKSS
jgi:holo-[acyl-carrier protein] synthase